MDVVVVESPAKAKTINKYLGSDYTVVASYGHIRDLPPRDGSVDPENGFSMEWEIGGHDEKHIRTIAGALKKADRLILATDPDREGEAISWHVQQELGQRNLLDGKEVRRVVFNEITKRAILEAMANPRDVNQQLVHAYLARRAMDYLVGFNLSPVLWRKLPGSRSAGRVQSVALRLICEREAEIEDFRTDEYWTIDGNFVTPNTAQFSARLTHFNGEKLDKLAIGGEVAAHAIEMALRKTDYVVDKVVRKQAKRHPAPPFTTSTLQQEAARKLHFAARKTMDVAQRLYEGIDLGGETVGLITYMRTDGVQMALEAVQSAREVIGKDFGSNYVPEKPRMYKTKAKNAQEAHEAIRPTDLRRTPASVAHLLSKDQFRLYDLVWKRTIASQMESAVLDQVAVDVAATSAQATLHATGSIVAFDGFLKVYREDADDSDSKDDKDRRLPQMEEGQALKLKDILSEQHFTQPPPRYTEASLVKKMEELGIGRPSTYASIISVLQDRNYVRLDQRRFIPEDRGRVVTAFLENYFTQYVQYTFTADLEHKLDEISDGRLGWTDVLSEFWGDFKSAIEATKELRVSEVLDQLDEDLGPHFFPPQDDGSNPRACPQCSNGRLGLKLGKHGAFIGCSNYPDCKYTRPLSVVGAENGEDGQTALDGPRVLGSHPDTGEQITVRKGPYGTYVQLGEEKTVDPEPGSRAKKPKVIKPKRVSLPRGIDPGTMGMDMALGLLSLPRDLGPWPETGEIIQAGLGRFGPYVKLGNIFKSLQSHDDVLTVDIERAIELLKDAPAIKNPPKKIGLHPDDGKPVELCMGRFGPFVQHNKIKATLQKADKDRIDAGEEMPTLERAVELLNAKAEKDGKGKKAPAKAKKTATKSGATKKAATKTKVPAKKTAAKKSPSKKTTAKKPAAKPEEDATS